MPPFDDEQPVKPSKKTRGRRGKLSQRKTRKLQKKKEESLLRFLDGISLLDVTKFTTVLLMNVLGDFTQNIIEPYENKHQDTSNFEKRLKTIVKPEKYFK